MAANHWLSDQRRFLILGSLACMLAAHPVRSAPVPKPATASGTILGFAPDEVQILQEMEEQDYFKHASCPEIANAVLAEAGLPRLGQSTPVRGDRQDMDRRGENAPFPRFVDGVIRSRSPYQAFRVEAKPGRGSWILKLTRELKRKGEPELRLETSFLFKQESRLNRTSCELDAIGLKGNFKSGSVPARMDAHDCLSVIQLDPQGLEAWIESAGHRPWIKEDCALGLHYFHSVKEVLLEAAKKQIR